MIVYESNKNWFRDIWHLTTSWTIRKIIYGVLIIGGYTLAVCLTLDYTTYEPRLHSSVFSLLGIVLSILLVFRTNTAYDRWWEGRKQWGALVNNCRNLSVMLHATLPKEDDESRSFYAKHIANFCIALKDHLRAGATTDNLVLLSDEEKAELNKKKHKPNHISFWIYNRMQQTYQTGTFDEADFINLKPQHQALLDILGACERILKTPIPYSYAVYIKIYITIYGLMLPFGLYNDFGLYTIPIVMFIFFAMIGIELMAQEIEEPFGLDCNDLSTADMAHNIKNNVFEIFEVSHARTESKEKELYTKVH
ncbi:hypothetical protein E1176_19550 [Fulvivirga sp. RKSG066]|uniref:bestrophin family protein n=1 Tax=Fulvivirga aurantia TaxID=2529383 RepID=UPI0012BD6C4A|nr:bestrophin family ion channel [Fulvivirga aurantia]MTI23233.1 hypothetical protein [Fulvivirga aurantia]